MTGPIADPAWRRGNLGHLLFVATGACVRDVLRIVHDGGFPDITEAQLNLFAHIDADGTRLTTLAVRAGVAKQSLIELVDRATRLDLVMRTPDPADARAKIVRLTPGGRRLARLVRRGDAAAVRQMTAVIGPERRDRLRRALAAYAGPAVSPGRAFDAAATRFARDVLAAVHPHGYAEVTEALLSVFRHLELDGSRLTDLAARARITKQSMRGLVDRAEALGFVERERGGADRRSRPIRFTAAGLAMLARFRAGVEVAERRFVNETGADLGEIKGMLLDLLGSDHPAWASALRSVASGGAAVNSPG